MAFTERERLVTHRQIEWRFFRQVECAVTAVIDGEHHGKRKRTEYQEEGQVQELRGQGPAEEGRQGGQVPALQGDGRTVTSAHGGFEQAQGFLPRGFLLSLR